MERPHKSQASERRSSRPGIDGFTKGYVRKRARQLAGQFGFTGRDCDEIEQRLYLKLGPLAVRLELCPPDRRRRDCDNSQKPILDALQQAGAFVDDSQIVWLLTTKGEIVPGGKAVVHIQPLADGIPWEAVGFCNNCRTERTHERE